MTARHNGVVARARAEGDPLCAAITMRETLPIDRHIPEILERLRAHRVVVVRAEPGTGKTTGVPPALLGAVARQQVVVVEPRRLAALAAAHRVSAELGEEVGGTVGYRVRHDHRGSGDTQLWYVTDGLLERDLLANPFLEGVDVLVIDEFHERRVASDLILALALFLQRTIRPELRLLLLSATFEVDRLRSRIGECAVFDCEGQRFPVDTYYTGADRAPLARQVIRAIRLALSHATHAGDTLVFLPGMAEIQRVRKALVQDESFRNFEILPLHGALPLHEQQRVFSPGSRRRLILATNVAESSITVPGVTAVVDSGWAREAFFDRSRSLNSLRSVRISQASAEQRRGRAGRVAPGICVRLGSESEFRSRMAEPVPEIQRVDLSGVVLTVAAWGLARPEELPWLDSPPLPALQTARSLLVRLGALDEKERLTSLGQELARWPVEVRLARWLVAAREASCGEDVALLAALLSEERALFPMPVAPARERPAVMGQSEDLWSRAERYCAAAAQGFSSDACRRNGVQRAAGLRAERTRNELLRLLGLPPADAKAPASDSPAFATLLLAYPDRVCRKRADDPRRATMVGGIGVRLQAPTEGDWFVALDVQWPTSGLQREGQVRVVSHLHPQWLDRMLPYARRHEQTLRFDEAAGRVVAEGRTMFFDLPVSVQRLPAPPCAEAGTVLFTALRDRALQVLSLSKTEFQLMARLEFLARTGIPGFAAFRDPDRVWQDVLRVVTEQATRVDEVRRADAAAVLRRILGSELLRRVDREAPSHLLLPNGRRAPLNYAVGAGPVLSVRIQEIFGWQRVPTVGSGRVPVLVELLAPNGRPVQRTADLASFWQSGYPEVRKQLRARYPKHAWPEDPLRVTTTYGRGGAGLSS